jgi:hypothetical protein
MMNRDATTDPLYEAINSDPLLRAGVEHFVAEYRENAERDKQIIEKLVEQPISPAHLEQLRRNAELRRLFLEQVPLLKSSEIAQLTGSTARNASAKASRWKKERRIFSISLNGTDRYPAFQFAPSGEPFPVMQQVLSLFQDWPEWTIGLWFFAANSWIEGERSPMEALQRNPAQVLEAAQREVEPFEF